MYSIASSQQYSLINNILLVNDLLFIDNSESHPNSIGKIELIKHTSLELFLCNFRVLPEYRGLGIGRAILEDIIECYKNRYKYISLTCTSNTKAISLYKALGFKETDIELLGKGCVNPHYIPSNCIYFRFTY